jgi:hypothetical protein
LGGDVYEQTVCALPFDDAANGLSCAHVYEERQIRTAARHLTIGRHLA